MTWNFETSENSDIFSVGSVNCGVVQNGPTAYAKFTVDPDSGFLRLRLNQEKGISCRIRQE
jgi:hypothetical protein